MSLCDKGVGLLETHVEWEDIEETLEATLGVNCKMGPNRSLRLIGEGEGFLSRIAVISPDWLEPNPKLPSIFCVKILSQLSQVEYDATNARTETMGKLFREMHNSEVDAYEFFEKNRTPGLKVAKLIAFRRFSEANQLKGFLVLPFFENLVKVRITDNMTLPEVEQVLEAIAEMNCVTLKMTDEEKAKIRSDFFVHMCGTYFTKESLIKYTQSVRRFMERDHPDLCDRFEAVRFKITAKESFQELDDLCRNLGMNPLLTHGDLWSANLLWSKPGKNHFLEAIVDYQSPVLTTPAVDICSLVCSALSGEDRLKYTASLIERYYSILQLKVKGEEMPFTLEQLKTSFIYIFPFHALEILGTLVELYADNLINPEMRDSLPEESQVLEKIHRLLESLLDYFDEGERLKAKK